MSDRTNRNTFSAGYGGETQVKKTSLKKLAVSFFALRAAYHMYRNGQSPADYLEGAKVAARIPVNQLWEAARGRMNVCLGCRNPVHRSWKFCTYCGAFLGGPEVFDEIKKNERKR